MRKYLRLIQRITTNIFFLSIIFLQALGSLELPVKCFEEYKKFSGTEFKFCIQGTQTDESSSKLCESGEYLSIFDFYIYLPREPEKTCGVLGGFTYKNTVTASCLHKENKHLAQRIAKTLITAYSGDQFENVNKTHVNLQLNNIVKQLALITVNYLCHPKNNSFIEMCKMSTVKEWNKGNIELNENSLKNLNPKPSSCECFVRSYKSNVSIEVLDARLGSSEKLQIIQGNSSSVSNLFEDSSFIWRKDGQKVLATNSIIKLVLKNFTLIESLWIVIEGQNMSVNCSPVYGNDRNTPDVQEESQIKFEESSLELPVKCFEEYKKFSGTEFKFCIQGTQTDESSSKLCESGEYLSIFDFYIYLPREPEKTCGVLGGFTYKNTVTASCLHKENKHLAQRIAKTLITAYSGDQFENVNKTHVNLQLNNIVKQLALITVNYLCHPKNNSFIEMCKMSTVKEWNKGNIELNENSLKNLNPKPSSCECFVRSYKSNVSIEVLDARLGSSEKLQIIQGNSSSVSNLFEDSSFIWRKDRQKVLATNSIIKLVLKNFTLIESLWIVIEGQNMSVNCSPVYGNDRNTPDVQEESQIKFEESYVSMSVFVGVTVTLSAIVIILIVAMVTMIAVKRHRTHSSNDLRVYDFPDSGKGVQYVYNQPTITSEVGAEYINMKNTS